MIIGGYQIIAEDDTESTLESIKIVKVFEHGGDEKFQIIYKKIEILESVLSFVFDGTKNHSIRVSAGSGTLAPIHRNYNFDSFFMGPEIGEIDEIITDWKNKEKKLIEYADYFVNNERDILPVLWYSKGVNSNDMTSSFLHFHRSIEVLARRELEELNNELKAIVEDKLKIDSKSSDIQKRSKTIGIPKNIIIPLFLEENEIKNETYNKWRWYRNKLTHADFGNLAFEFDDEFRRESRNLRITARKLISKYINDCVSRNKQDSLIKS